MIIDEAHPQREMCAVCFGWSCPAFGAFVVDNTNYPPWRFCCLARGIPGVRFLPKRSRIWGRLRATRSVISSLGLARNYVPDGPQTTLKSETLRVKPHVWRLFPARYPPPDHVVSPWKCTLLDSFEGYPKRNFQPGRGGSKFRLGGPFNDPEVETL